MRDYKLNTYSNKSGKYDFVLLTIAGLMLLVPVISKATSIISEYYGF